MLTQDLQNHLISMGILPKSLIEDLEDITAPVRQPVFEYQDPRDENGEVCH
jgi:hypothetical protein